MFEIVLLGQVPLVNRPSLSQGFSLEDLTPDQLEQGLKEYAKDMEDYRQKLAKDPENQGLWDSFRYYALKWDIYKKLLDKKRPPPPPKQEPMPVETPTPPKPEPKPVPTGGGLTQLLPGSYPSYPIARMTPTSPSTMPLPTTESPYLPVHSLPYEGEGPVSAPVPETPSGHAPAMTTEYSWNHGATECSPPMVPAPGGGCMPGGGQGGGGGYGGLVSSAMTFGGGGTSAVSMMGRISLVRGIGTRALR